MCWPPALSSFGQKKRPPHRRKALASPTSTASSPMLRSMYADGDGTFGPNILAAKGLLAALFFEGAPPAWESGSHSLARAQARDALKRQIDEV